MIVQLFQRRSAVLHVHSMCQKKIIRSPKLSVHHFNVHSSVLFSCVRIYLQVPYNSLCDA